MIGADNGGIGWRDWESAGPHMSGQMTPVAGGGISLICRRHSGARVGIPPGAALGVNDLRSEPPGL